MSQFTMNNKRNKLAYLLSIFLVTTPQLAQAEQQSTPSSTKAAQTQHQHEADSQQLTYACPMHPEVTSHKAGERCPKCNMFLTLVEGNNAAVKEDELDHSAMTNMAMASAEQKTYACPMHPEVTSHEEGARCPKCNMFLTLVQGGEEEEEEQMAMSMDMASAGPTVHSTHNQQAVSPADTVFNAAKPAALNAETTIKYVCPMHAHIISDEEGTCPICGMNLVKVEVGGSSTEIEINVSGSMQQALAIKVAKTEVDTLWKFVQTVGEVDYDESQIHHVHSRVSGWVETLNVNAVGDPIKKGQLLYELYSPELINAQDDFLLAQDTLKRSNNRASYKDLVRRSGLRLELLGFTKGQIKLLASSKKSQYTVPFYAQTSGVVKELTVRDGMYIQPATEIMSIVDLSKVWVIADVFENEQSWLEIGQEAKVSVPAMDLIDIKGEIDYIYPELDPVTRSLRVRIVLSNMDVALRPNTLAKIEILGGPNANVLVIPQEALIQTGKENRVIVKLTDNTFTARKVKVGMMSQGKAEIVEGLSEGELVITSGQFLLDSEASLKGSLMRLSSGKQH